MHQVLMDPRLHLTYFQVLLSFDLPPTLYTPVVSWSSHSVQFVFGMSPLCDKNVNTVKGKIFTQSPLAHMSLPRTLLWDP